MKNKNNTLPSKCYAMAQISEDAAEITMYGEIVQERPVDYWTGEPIEGSFIIESEFLKDLEQLKSCKEITIRMNSCGGDAGVSNLIHNRLREFSDSGIKTKCIVDGAAMSGGSLIMCACDTVEANPSSIIMIHKAWSYMMGGYNADELRAAAERSDAYDKMQAEIYQRKTGLSETKVLYMMGNTTYMTGREALEYGFVDALLDGEQLMIAASEDRRSLYLNGKYCSTMQQRLPDSLPTVTPDAAASVTNTNQEGGGEMATTIEELRAEFPELTAQLEQEAKASVSADDAVNAERKRLQEIDKVSALFDDALVQEAKYGENACTAQELSYRAALKAAGQGKAFLASLQQDYNASGADGVGAAPAPQQEVNENDPVAIAEQAKADAQKFQAKMKKEGK